MVVTTQLLFLCLLSSWSETCSSQFLYLAVYHVKSYCKIHLQLSDLQLHWKSKHHICLPCIVHYCIQPVKRHTINSSYLVICLSWISHLTDIAMNYPSMPCFLAFTAQSSDLIDLSVALTSYNKGKKSHTAIITHCSFKNVTSFQKLSNIVRNSLT